MSRAGAIAAVTATLQRLIFHAVSHEPGLAGSHVTARPPDRARVGETGSQLNLFLYHVALDAALRNQDPPGTRPGENGRPALALELSYLITAYGDADNELHADHLLGVAMLALHDRPLLRRSDIAAALPQSTGLEDQLERLRITPHPIPLNEVSRLWATFGTGYRTSVSYQVGAVLIDSIDPISAALPVLRRGAEDAGPRLSARVAPQIDLAVPPNGQPAARHGDTVVLLGRHLGEVTNLRLAGIRLGEPVFVPPASATPTRLTLEVPPPASLPAGPVTVAALFDDGGGTMLAGNEAPLAIAPTLLPGAGLKAKLDGKGAATVTVRCEPPVVPGQTVALVVGDRVVPVPAGAPDSAPRSKLAFKLSGFDPGGYTVRLRVDGQDSIPLDLPPVAEPPPGGELGFDPKQRLVLT